MGIVSYAQNFEDVMLWRALRGIERGFYIDIGAQDPVRDSVSRVFYGKGWRGVHVEPTTHYADLLRQDRPDEVVIQAAVSDQSGILRFFEIPNTGLSTASPEVAQMHLEKGFTVRETAVAAVTLDQILIPLDSLDVHWMKVDIEGFEKQLLSGWREARCRPWIIVIEGTYPNTAREVHQEWEEMILAKGYTAAYFDGTNRFYVSHQHPELMDALRFGPSITDGFQVVETSWAAAMIRHRYENEIAVLTARNAELESQIAACREALSNAQSPLAAPPQAVDKTLAGPA